MIYLVYEQELKLFGGIMLYSSCMQKGSDARRGFLMKTNLFYILKLSFRNVVLEGQEVYLSRVEKVL
jgi:hypothetical protein